MDSTVRLMRSSVYRRDSSARRRLRAWIKSPTISSDLHQQRDDQHDDLPAVEVPQRWFLEADDRARAADWIRSTPSAEAAANRPRRLAVCVMRDEAALALSPASTRSANLRGRLAGVFERIHVATDDAEAQKRVVDAIDGSARVPLPLARRHRRRTNRAPVPSSNTLRKRSSRDAEATARPEAGATPSSEVPKGSVRSADLQGFELPARQFAPIPGRRPTPP